MKNFDKVEFKGTFRDYQARILEKVDGYMKDHKLHIVAAPGSGKTILGLEIIRRLWQPCLIFSPTTTIRNQWGDRFEDSFLSQGEDASEYVSFDLRKTKLLTSITYQALYSAMSKTKLETEDETVDYSGVDIFKTIEENNISVVCLDEAHHLQNEWQKALEKFIAKLGKNVRVVSLTATPPYDASPAEWKRYIDVCGEIDEEIFVPELVKRKNLCPHQDYIYFNFPTNEEINEFSNYKMSAAAALEEILKFEIWENIYAKISEMFNRDDEFLFANVKIIISLLVMASRSGVEADSKIVKALTTKKELPKYDIQIAETALQFLISNEEFCGKELCEQIRNVLQKNGLIERGKVSLDLNEKLKRKLVASMGKIESIKQIAKCEVESLGQNLRMLVLTDYIKKESTEKVGTDKNFNAISVVSIFENLRRELPKEMSIAVLSGSLVILNKACLDKLKNQNKVKFTSSKIANTDYFILKTTANNREKVDIVGKLFENGDIQILVGTKSLLGEGWDSPCINSLVLASFVGSFMLSNQMRGRAIRVDKNNPDKTSNIWHLVTIEPSKFNDEKLAGAFGKKYDFDKNKIVSCDYETLCRRFDCFVGPNYETGKIESGVDRVTIIKPPFDEGGIEAINGQMKTRAADRESMAKDWNVSLQNSCKTLPLVEVPSEKKVPHFSFLNFGLLCAVTTILFGFSVMLAYNVVKSTSGSNMILLAVVLVLFLISVNFLGKLAYKIFHHLNPLKSIKTLSKCVLETLQFDGVIDDCARVKVLSECDVLIDVALVNAGSREQAVFAEAIKEMLSVIENPRYLIIRKKKSGRYDFVRSFACPSIIGKNKELAEFLASRLKKTLGDMEVVYTRNEKGRKMILKCRQKSYLTFNEEIITGQKLKVVDWQ